MYEIKLENRYGEVLPLTNNKNYEVKAAGLTPVNSNIVTSPVANYGGERFVSSRQQKRNIVLTIFVNNPVETNRINLYRYIKTADYIKLYYKNKTRDVYIEGRVESIDGDLFEQTQTIQVSIICPQPQFIDVHSNELNNNAVSDNISFPFSTVTDVREGLELTYNGLKNGYLKFTNFLINPLPTVTGNPTPTEPFDPIGLGENLNDIYYIKLCMGVGKRNLYSGTKWFTGYDWLNFDQWVFDTIMYEGFEVLKRTGSSYGLCQNISVVVGETYTFSAWVKSATDDVYFYSTGGTGLTDKNIAQVRVSTEWSRVSITFNVTLSGTIKPRFENGSNSDLFICGIKLEKSDTVTKWVPSPEDEMDIVRNFTSVLIPIAEQSNGVNLVNGGKGLINVNNYFIDTVLTDADGSILTNSHGSGLVE